MSGETTRSIYDHLPSIYDTFRYVVNLRTNLRPIVPAISFLNNHRGRKLSIRLVVRPITVYDLSLIAPQVSEYKPGLQYSE